MRDRVAAWASKHLAFQSDADRARLAYLDRSIFWSVPIMAISLLPLLFGRGSGWRILPFLAVDLPLLLRHKPDRKNRQP